MDNAHAPPSDALIIRSARIRLALRLLLGAAGLTFGMSLMFGFGSTLLWIATGVAALSVGSFALGVMTDKPRLVIRPDGFDFHPLFRCVSHTWSDIDGGFTVVRVGIAKMIAFNLTSEYKSNLKKTPSRPPFGGRDAAIVGEFEQTAERIAQILNERQAAWLSVQSGQPVSPDWQAAPPPKTRADRRPAGNGSIVLRVLSGILATLFAVSFPFMLRDKTLTWTAVTAMAGMVVCFGAFAILGLRGLPSWLTKPPFSR